LSNISADADMKSGTDKIEIDDSELLNEIKKVSRKANQKSSGHDA
jgi:hypothetical protein